jgi:hypothetical protein
MRAKKKTVLEKRLMAYTAAAVGALAIAPAAEAAVRYSGPENLTLNPQTPVAVDLNNDGVADFGFAAYGYAYTYNYSGYQYAFSVGVAYLNPTTSGGKGGTGFISTNGASQGTLFSYPAPARLATGYRIQNSLPTYGWTNTYFGILEGQIKLKYGNEAFSYSLGKFRNATGCIGVRFNTDDGTRYGWIRFQGTSPSSGVIKDWAYEDTGGPIDACVVPAVSVPALNQWGVMVLIALLAGISLKAIKTEKDGQDT